jgi:hypothetical protein
MINLSVEPGQPHRRARPYPQLWLAQSVNYFGDQVYAVALPWLVLNETHSGSAMELTFAAGMLPYLFFGVAGGSSSDQGHRRRTLLVGNGVAALAVASLCAVAAASGSPVRTWVFVTVALVIAAATSYSASAAESMVPVIFSDPSELRRANSYLEASNSASQVLGPGLAGMLIATFTAIGALGVDAGSFAFAMAVFAMCATGRLQGAAPAPSAEHRKADRDIAARWRQGVSRVVRHPVLRAGATLSTLNNLILGGFDTLLILILHHSDHLGAESVAAVVACGGLGAVMSAAVIVPRLRVRRTGLVMVAAIAACGAAAVAIGAVQLLPVAAGAEFIFGASATMFNVLWRTLRQRTAGPDMVGRVAGASRGIAYAGAAIGGLVNAGLLALGAHATSLFVIEGAMVTAVALGFYLGPLASATAS